LKSDTGGILATWEIRRIEVPGPLAKNVHKTPSQQKKAEDGDAGQPEQKVRAYLHNSPEQKD
jgi:hypothetical protein